ncbi:MAG TPA: hypothetical protein V6C72_13355, partial [Chroococcales cyanobacterium]
VIAFQMYLLALILPIYLRYRWKITASGEPIVPKAKQAKPMPIKNSEKVEVEVAKSSGEPANG